METNDSKKSRSRSSGGTRPQKPLKHSFNPLKTSTSLGPTLQYKKDARVTDKISGDTAMHLKTIFALALSICFLSCSQLDGASDENTLEKERWDSRNDPTRFRGVAQI